MKQRRPQIRVWFMPIALGVVIATGLIAALLSDKAGDLVGWLALAAPVCVVMWFARSRQTSS